MQLLWTPWKDELIKLLKEVEEEVFLCSPYLNWEIIQEISEILGDRSLRILTSDYAGSETLLNLYKSDIETRLIENLHAKIYLMDEKLAIVTSSNLTKEGLKEKREVGVRIESPDLIDDLKEELDYWWERARDLSEIKPEELEQLPARSFRNFPRSVRRLGTVVPPRHLAAGIPKDRVWDELVKLAEEIRLNRFILADLLLDPDRAYSEGEIPPVDRVDPKGKKVVLEEWEWHKEGMSITQEKSDRVADARDQFDPKKIIDAVVEKIEITEDEHKPYLKALFDATDGIREWVTREKWLEQCKQNSVETRAGTKPKSISPFMTRNVFFVKGLIEIKGRGPQKYRITELGKAFVKRKC